MSEGFVSWREKSSGSWYVEMLDSVLEQYAHSEDLLSMLLRVNVLFALLSVDEGNSQGCDQLGHGGLHSKPE